MTRRVKARIDAFVRRHDRPELRASWRHAANFTQRELQRLENVDLSSYRFLLVARQTHPLLRALILRAEEQGVPTVYLPHSPLTRFQIDLPVSHAALRGEAERDWVVAHTAADPSRIAVVGNPATDVVARPLPSVGARPGVLAVSPDPEPQLRRMVDLLAGAGLDDVIIAPHPRSDLALLRRLLRPGWSLADPGRTIDMLREGPRWVIQCSSGVAWESSVLGIPTANLRFDDAPPVYPFLEDEAAVPALRTAEDVRRFISGAENVDADDLRRFALDWCGVDGPESIARARALLERVSEPLPRLVDAWAPNGILRRASPLSEL